MLLAVHGTQFKRKHVIIDVGFRLFLDRDPEIPIEQNKWTRRGAPCLFFVVWLVSASKHCVSEQDCFRSENILSTRTSVRAPLRSALQDKKRVMSRPFGVALLVGGYDEASPTAPPYSSDALAALRGFSLLQEAIRHKPVLGSCLVLLQSVLMKPSDLNKSTRGSRIPEMSLALTALETSQL